MSNALRYKAARPYHQPLFISPQSVSHWLFDKSVLPFRTPGRIVAGAWDSDTVSRQDRLQKSDKYIGLCERFVHGMPWSQTMLFQQRYSRELKEKGRARGGATTLQELEKVYERYDRMFEDIKAHGVIAPTRENGFDWIYIYIGRNGEIIYTSNGNHRLYMAIILDVATMPVRVLWRHEEWQLRRETLSALPPSERLLHIDDKLKSHADLADLLQD